MEVYKKCMRKMSLTRFTFFDLIGVIYSMERDNITLKRKDKNS